MKLFTVVLALTALATGTVACSSAQQPIEATTKPQIQQQVPVPDAVKVPAGNRLVGSFEGVGVQIYHCTNNAWTLVQPAAIISDNGKPIALHSKGPVWVSTIDGSSVAATPVPNAAVTHDDAVPELLLKAIENHGSGQFGSVTYVERLATKGGLPPKGACIAGTQESVKYSATYTFYASVR
jgi:cytochrome c5